MLGTEQSVCVVSSYTTADSMVWKSTQLPSSGKYPFLYKYKFIGCVLLLCGSIVSIALVIAKLFH